MKSLQVEQIARALKLSKLQKQLLNLYCEGIDYSNDFIVKMGQECKTMNAAELRHNISVLSETH